jgi:hypothetical protein
VRVLDPTGRAGCWVLGSGFWVLGAGQRSFGHLCAKLCSFVRLWRHADSVRTNPFGL